MKRTLIIAMGMILFATSALAFNEPKDFRGIPWGASEADVIAGLTLEAARQRGYTPEEVERFKWSFRDRISCTEIPQKLFGDLLCSGLAIEIGPARNIETSYTLRANRLVAVGLRFKPDQFSLLEEIFIQRYGPPTDTRETPFKTQGGLQSVNRVLWWLGKDVSIQLQRYAGKITEGSARLQTVAESNEYQRRLKEEKFRGAGDL